MGTISEALTIAKAYAIREGSPLLCYLIDMAIRQSLEEETATAMIVFMPDDIARADRIKGV